MVGKVDNFKHDFRVFLISWRVQLRAAMALRGAFMIQIGGMVVNNLAFVFAWLFMFERFGELNGWGGAELIALQGVIMIVFGAVMLFSGGFMDLARHVDQGSFDNFLTKPTSVIGRIATSHLDVPAFGDLLLGIVLTGWYISYVQPGFINALLFIVAMIVACVVFWCAAIVLPAILAFYIFDSDRLTRYISSAFLESGMYPTGVLTGVLRTIFLTVMPGLLIGAVPITMLQSLDWRLLLIAIVVMAIWFVITMKLFKYSINRYESANLVGSR